MTSATLTSVATERVVAILAKYYGNELMLAGVERHPEKNGFVTALTSSILATEDPADSAEIVRVIDPYNVELRHTQLFDSIYLGSGAESFFLLVEFANQRESKDLDRDGRPQPLISKSYVFSEQSLFKEFEGEESETLMQAQIVLNQDSRAEYLLHLVAVRFESKNPSEAPERGIEITLQTNTHEARIYIPIVLELVQTHTDDTKSEIASQTEKFFVMTAHTKKMFAKEIN